MGCRWGGAISRAAMRLPAGPGRMVGPVSEQPGRVDGDAASASAPRRIHAAARSSVRLLLAPRRVGKRAKAWDLREVLEWKNNLKRHGDPGFEIDAKNLPAPKTKRRSREHA